MHTLPPATCSLPLTGNVSHRTRLNIPRVIFESTIAYPRCVFTRRQVFATSATGKWQTQPLDWAFCL